MNNNAYELRIYDSSIPLIYIYIHTWHNMKAWNNEDMCRTDALDCSGNPENITCTWSATWQDTSCGIGCADGIDWPWLLCVLLPAYIEVCVREPNSNHDSNLIWPIQSTYSRALEMTLISIFFKTFDFFFLHWISSSTIITLVVS